jgi:hypothetical protein
VLRVGRLYITAFDPAMYFATSYTNGGAWDCTEL